jgi:hypothetical protein
MLSFLRRAQQDAVQDVIDENRILLDEFSALDQARQDEAAEKLAVLWHCFVEVFGSPGKFHGEPRTVQDAYIVKFERVAARSRHVTHSENGHLHYSVALMLQFLIAARDNDRRQSALDLSQFVADLINRVRERQLETTRDHLVDALSKSLEKSSESPSTDLMVDHALEFHETADQSDQEERARIIKLHQDLQVRK